MLELRTFTTIAILLATVTGCAGTSRKALDVSEASNIRKIVILTIPEPPRITVHNMGSGAVLLGGVLAVAIANGVSETHNTDPLTKLLLDQGFDFSKEMQQELKNQLGRMGYDVQLVEAQRKNPMGLLKDYSGYSSLNTDAILDVALGMNFGYANVNIMDNEFRPDIEIRTQLIAKQTGKVLYSEGFIYGYHNPFMSATQIPAPKVFYFPNSDDLYTDKQRAVAGLRAGISAIAAALANQLKH